LQNGNANYANLNKKTRPEISFRPRSVFSRFS
jgi:hypothetical protein